MKILIVFLLFFPSFVTANDFPGFFSGEVSVEYRHYPNEGDYGNTEKHHGSVIVKPEYSISWDNDRSVISIVPFARLDQEDSDRSHFDIRELSYVLSWADLELRIGISKVFWGVTESQHLVDVVNQTDLVENPDGEKKLGQPMINPTFVTAAGNFEFFVLPYFRERTFAGEDGRYRSAVIIDTNQAQYRHEDENTHVDYAVRWSSSIKDLEWALSYFKGTDRDPYFQFDAINNRLIPVYGQSEQFGLELQYIYKDLLGKAEYLRKDSPFYSLYSASTIGLEYTITNIAKGMDIGLIYEWLYDGRGNSSPSGMHDASFYAIRLAYNDEASKQILAGAIFNNDTADMNFFRIEASQRIAQSLSLDVEVNIVGNPPANSFVDQFRSDDYIQITLTGYY